MGARGGAALKKDIKLQKMGARGGAALKKDIRPQRQRSLCSRCLIFGIISLISASWPSGVCDTGFSNAEFDSISQFQFQSPGNLSPPIWSSNSILLTPDPTTTVTQHQLHNVGRLLYNQSFQFMPSSGSKRVFSFKTSFTFKITTTSSYGKCGDGLAFVVTGDSQVPSNSTGRYLGLASQIQRSHPSPFLAVEFDTFQNLELAINDPSASHIGIDINSLDSLAILDTSGNHLCCSRENVSYDFEVTRCPLCDGQNVNSSASSAHLRNKSYVRGYYPELFLYNNYTFTAWVEYNTSSQLIQVWATNQRANPRPQMPCLSLHYNLADIFLPQMYVGISATSGNNFEGSTLYSWSFTIEDNTSNKEHKRMLMGVAIIGAVVAIAGAGGAVCILAAVRTRRRRRDGLSMRKLDRLPRMEMGLTLTQQYSYKKLKRAVQGFHEKAKVGEGGYSSVYKGILRDGTQIAVKRLKDGLRMEAEFTTEVQIISQIRHRNLLQLQGWCYERGEALLVYEFMPNGSLDSYLFGSRKASQSCLDRLKVLMGVAAALEYLHTGLGDCVLHRDVKAANVLLSDKFEAMLGDFGLARLITHDQVVTITIAGTPGYVAPEVIYTGKATDKADVYGFGVLALEVACGRRALDPSLDMRLQDWVWMLHQNNTIMEALDPSIKFSCACLREQEAMCREDDDLEQSMDNMVNYELQWRCVLHLGLLCCHPSPDSRPNMRQVHQALQETTLLPLPLSRPMYPPSYELSSVCVSNLSSTYSLSHSAPSVSDVPSTNSQSALTTLTTQEDGPSNSLLTSL